MALGYPVDKVDAVAVSVAENTPPISRFNGQRFVSTEALAAAGVAKLVSEETTGDEVRSVTLMTAGAGDCVVPDVAGSSAPETMHSEMSGQERPVGYIPEVSPTDDQEAPPSVVKSSA